MAPTISVSNERKTKCRRSQRSNHQTVSSTVSVISYGRASSRRLCWNQRPSRFPVMGKSPNRESRREPPQGEMDDVVDGSPMSVLRFQRRQSTSSMSESDSSSGCSSAGHSMDFSSSQHCRCDSLNMSDYDDDGFKEDKTNLCYPSRVEFWPERNCWEGSGNNTKGLLDIAIKTIKLIQRNQLLQAKLAQLQAETQAFITSVMANPENRDVAMCSSDRESSLSSPEIDET